MDNKELMDKLTDLYLKYHPVCGVTNFNEYKKELEQLLNKKGE
jgi:hypothetical protein